MTDSVTSDFTLVMPLDVPRADVERMAERSIRTMLKVSNFEITKIVLLEKGELETPKGKLHGERYKVFYRNNLPN